MGQSIPIISVFFSIFLGIIANPSAFASSRSEECQLLAQESEEAACQCFYQNELDRPGYCESSKEAKVCGQEIDFTWGFLDTISGNGRSAGWSPFDWHGSFSQFKGEIPQDLPKNQCFPKIASWLMDQFHKKIVFASRHSSDEASQVQKLSLIHI